MHRPLTKIQHDTLTLAHARFEAGDLQGFADTIRPALSAKAAGPMTSTFGAGYTEREDAEREAGILREHGIPNVIRGARCVCVKFNRGS